MTERRDACGTFRVREIVTVLLCTLGPLLAPGAPHADGIMLVPAGAFWMGRDGGPPEEAPRHRVFVRDFWMERHKVTNAEFATFLELTGPWSVEGHRRVDERAQGGWAAEPDVGRQPVVDASWFGARDYCAWRSRRLPSEAEWEKAARDGAVYGVEDLLNTVPEWTATTFRPYPYPNDALDRDDPRGGPRADVSRVVVRGVGHAGGSGTPSVTARRGVPRPGRHGVGFRCATSEDLGEVSK